MAPGGSPGGGLGEAPGLQLEITSQRTAVSTLAVCIQRSAQLSLLNVATALHRVAKMQESQRAGAVDASLSKLLERAACVTMVAEGSLEPRYTSSVF